MVNSGLPFLGSLSGRLVGCVLLLLTSVLLAGCQTVSETQAPIYLDTFSLGEITVSYAQADRPLLVAELDGEISKSLAGSSTLGNLGTRFGGINRQGR